MRRIVAVTLAAFATAGCGAKSFDDCVLKAMAGQTESMRETAERVCETKHQRRIWSEQENGTWSRPDIQIGWWTESRKKSGLISRDFVLDVVVEVKGNNTPYQISKIDVLFSRPKAGMETKVGCDGHLGIDLEPALRESFVFSRWRENQSKRRFARSDAQFESASSARCAQYVAVYGIRRD